MGRHTKTYEPTTFVRNIAIICVIIPALAALFFAIMSFAEAHADGPTTAYEMNEKKGATVLHDAVGSLDGRIGKHITANGNYLSYPFVKNESGVVNPANTVTVPDNTALDPENADYSVTVKLRWKPTWDRNVIQKGQGSPAGGMFKMKTTVSRKTEPPGVIKCLFRGDRGDSSVNSYTAGRLDDQKWHKVTCGRDSYGTYMVVDGTTMDTNSNDPGFISNDWPLAIGGNTYCDGGTTMRCNYWWGQIGYVRVRKG